MKKHIFSPLILVFSALFIFSSCNKEEDKSKTVDQILSSMSVREKVGQLFFIRPETITGKAGDKLDQGKTVVELTDKDRDFFELYPVGGVCLFAQNIINPTQVAALNSAIHSLPYSPLICVDEEGGRVARLANNPNFNLKKYGSAAAISASGDEKDAVDAGKYISSYLAQYSFDIDFAPVADVNTNPENIVIGDRAFSNDPETASKMVVAFLKGLSFNNVTGCLKHFPGHGDVKGDTHTGYVATQKTWPEMVNCEMIPFKGGINAGAKMIMTAHIAAPNVTKTDLPSTMSTIILKDKLRTELGYKGIIITDAMEMGAIAQHYTPAEAAVGSILAGVDIVLLPYNFRDAFDAVLKAVEEGTISTSRLDESVRRVLSLKMEKGMLKK